MIVKNISVHGWPAGHALDCEESIAFAQNFGVKCLVEKYPLQDVEKGVQCMLSGDSRFRVVLTMD